jgi:hypothetical protein
LSLKLERAELERSVFAGKFNKVMSAVSKVPNEDAKDTSSTEESADFRQSLARAPITDGSNPRLVRESSFIRATVTKYGDLWRANCELVTGECSSAIFHALNDAIKVLEMFPNKTTNAGVLWNSFAGTIWEYVASSGTFNWDVVDVGDGDVRDLWL